MNRPTHPWPTAPYPSAPRQAAVIAPARHHLTRSHISLSQWNTLLAVVHHGSFARAAEVLHISQPAISYRIAMLEERLGISILEPDGRRAAITDAGFKLLAYVEPLMEHAVRVEAAAQELRASWRPEIRLAVVEDFATARLIPAIGRFSEEHATVMLSEASPEGVLQQLRSGEAQLGITRTLGSGLTGDVLAEIEYLPVAHPSSPLLALARPLATADLRSAIEVIVDSEPAPSGKPGRGRRAGPKRWNVSTLEKAEQAVMQGVGYAWLPRPQVQSAVDDARLAVLPLDGLPGRVARFYLARLPAGTPTDEVVRLTSTLREAAVPTVAAGTDKAS